MSKIAPASENADGPPPAEEDIELQPNQIGQGESARSQETGGNSERLAAQETGVRASIEVMPTGQPMILRQGEADNQQNQGGDVADLEAGNAAGEPAVNHSVINPDQSVEQPLN